LFSAATQVGGIIANASEAHTKALHTYGDALGICFQIVDDLLDYDGSDATGKNVGDDFREGKLTLPLIKAIAKANAHEREFWRRVIEKGHQESGDFETAQELMETHGAMENARTDAIGWAAKARSALQELPPHEIRTMLHDIADYVVARIR